MLTVDFDRLEMRPGSRVLDLGCGGGRHAFEAWRRGATVVALDRSEGELKDARAVVGGMLAAGELADGAPGGVVNGDALALPMPDGVFDAVIASEVLEHVWDDRGALAELVRVLRPGGRLAVTVPTRWPERVCWALDHRYHDLLARQIAGRAPLLATVEHALNPVLGKSVVVYAQRCDP